MPVVRFKNFDKIIIIAHAYGSGNFGERFVGRDDQVPRFIHPLFVDIVLGRFMRIFLKQSVELFLR